MIFQGKRWGWCRQPIEKLQCDPLDEYYKWLSSSLTIAMSSMALARFQSWACHVQRPKLNSCFLFFISKLPPHKALPWLHHATMFSHPGLLYALSQDLFWICADIFELLIFTCLSLFSSGPTVKTHVSESIQKAFCITSVLSPRKLKFSKFSMEQQIQQHQRPQEWPESTIQL